MKTQHTAGTWLLRSSVDTNETLVWNDNRCPIAKIPWDGFTENNETEANAARIVACVNACAGLADPAADLATLREALRVIAEMADEQREHFNEVWDRVDPKNNWDGNAANVRGGYISIAGKARAVLARVQGKEAE